MLTFPKIPDMTAESHARVLDAHDPLASFRARFYLQPGTLYLDGTLPILWGFWDQGDLPWERKPSTRRMYIR